MTVRSIDEFVLDLRKIAPARFTRETVLAEFGRVMIEPSSLEPYMFFCESHYTRNLIYRDDLFEVIALGWEKGQGSSVHNHCQQECWMGVPVGRLEVQNYRLLEIDETAQTCKLAPTDRFVIDPARPAAVDPSEPIHAIMNLAEFGQRALSVHIYSRPIDSCMVYQPAAGRCFSVSLDYTSRFGVLAAGKTAELVRA